MMAKTYILALLTWTVLQSIATLCDTADTCVAVRPCDNAKNIGSLESATEKKLAELQAVTEKLQDAVNSLAKQNEDLTSKVNDRQGRCIDFATLKLETKAQLTTFSNDLGNLKRDVGPNVGFSASLGDRADVHVGPAGVQTIEFKNVFINNGNAYDPATGIFTAPLKGAFQFTFTTYGYSAYGSGARLMKNGHQQVTTWQASGKHHSDSTSGAVILSLNAGDKVNLITWGNGFQVFGNRNHHTTFSGVLLFPL